MKQEFVILYGKAVIEGKTLYFHSPYLPFEKTAFAQIGLELVWLFTFVLRIVTVDTKMDMMIAIVWAMLTLGRLPIINDKFFKRSYANRIPLAGVHSYSAEDDTYGIQTIVKLHLKNGRYRKMIFRTHEKQVEPFIAALQLNEFAMEAA
jgi:hypothetical protein